MQPSRIQVYFIDSDDYFQKLDTDSDEYGFNRDDNDERAIFFARGTIETVKKLRWNPDIIQCTGIITALTPVYLRNMYADEPTFQGSKIIYTVMPGEISGKIATELIDKLRNDKVNDQLLKLIPEDGDVDTNTLHKLAIAASDAVIFHTETPNHALLEFVQQSGLPYATLQDVGSDPKLYLEFYNKLSEG